MARSYGAVGGMAGRVISANRKVVNDARIEASELEAGSRKREAGSEQL
jgi:hypothetical protein